RPTRPRPWPRRVRTDRPLTSPAPLSIRAILPRHGPGESPHMTIPPRLFDHQQIARNLARRKADENFVRDLVLEDLADRLSAMKRSFARAILIGPDARTLPEVLFTADGPVPVQRIDAFTEGEFPSLPEGQ